jgi:hypothetical protein
MSNQRLQFDDHTTKIEKQTQTSRAGIITQLVMKLPGIQTQKQATSGLLVVISLCVIITIYSLISSTDESYYIPPEAFQNQILDE